MGSIYELGGVLLFHLPPSHNSTSRGNGNLSHWSLEGLALGLGVLVVEPSAGALHPAFSGHFFVGIVNRLWFVWRPSCIWYPV